MNLIRAVLLLVLVLLFVMLGGAAVLWVRFMLAPMQQPVSAVATPTAVVNQSPAPTEVAPTQQADQKIAQLEQQIKTTAPGTQAPFTVTFSQAEVNAVLTQSIQQGVSSPLQNPTVVLSAGLVTVNGLYSGNGLSQVPVQTSAVLAVQNGQLHTEIQKVAVSSVPLPVGMVPRFQTQLSAQINAFLQRQTASAPIILQRVDVNDGSITFAGTTK